MSIYWLFELMMHSNADKTKLTSFAGVQNLNFLHDFIFFRFILFDYNDCRWIDFRLTLRLSILPFPE